MAGSRPVPAVGRVARHACAGASEATTADHCDGELAMIDGRAVNGGLVSSVWCVVHFSMRGFLVSHGGSLVR